MKTAGKEKRMFRLFLLFAIGGVLFVATPCAAVTPCRFDGIRCKTNQDCCSGVCTANVCGPRTTKCQAFPATGQTSSFHAGDDGAIQAGAPLQFEDNGDGTITDENTGLMWEKKSADGSIHDHRNAYNWFQAFDVHVARLNSMNFAGHDDWRLPNVRELESIVNYGNVNPAVSPAFNTNCTPGCVVLTCSCTAVGGPDPERGFLYWSSTTDARDPFGAWGVNFESGFVIEEAKDLPNNQFVRAVRAGSADDAQR